MDPVKALGFSHPFPLKSTSRSKEMTEWHDNFRVHKNPDKTTSIPIRGPQVTWPSLTHNFNMPGFLSTETL